MIKICASCKQKKSTDEFQARSASKDGLGCYCCLCARAKAKDHYLANKERRILQVTDWRKKHSDQVRIYQQTWRKNTAAKVKSMKI